MVGKNKTVKKPRGECEPREPGASILTLHQPREPAEEVHFLFQISPTNPPTRRSATLELNMEGEEEGLKKKIIEGEKEREHEEVKEGRRRI